MFQQPTIAVPISDLIKFVANGLGAPIVLHAATQLKGRLPRYRKVRDAYAAEKQFSKAWFWSFLFLILNLFIIVGILLAILAILILITALPGGVDWIKDTIGNWVVEKLPTIGWIGLGISIAGLFVVYLEWGISFNSLKHWLTKRHAERILANRIKRELPGLFRVIDENCDRLADGITARLKANPDWLFGTLIRKRPDDKGTLANELLLGTLFEHFMYKEFGGEWTAFLPIQDHLINDKPLASPSNIAKMSSVEMKDQLNTFFAGKGKPLSKTLRDAITTNLDILKQNYNSTALRILEFSRPRFSAIVIGAAVLSLLLSLINLVPELSTFVTGLSNKYMWLPGLIKWSQITCILLAVTLILTQPRSWIQWINLKLRLADRFEIVQYRLKAFEGFHIKTVRLAFAKFAYEYGLLDIDPKELTLGNSAHLNLALLKTGALWTDAPELSMDDSGLLYFSDAAMRKTADYLEDKLLQEIKNGFFAQLGWKGATDLVGEYYPYNTVDGSLYLIGHQYCSKNACRNENGDGCPLFRFDLCDSKEEEGFTYDKESRHFIKKKL